MACCTVILQEQRKKSLLWVWKSNTDPLDLSVREWTAYTDVENEIIEEAYLQNKSEAILDDFHINFKRLLQISNTNEAEQRPVKRITRDENERKVRENRFLPISISSIKAFADDSSTFDYVDKVEEKFKSFYQFGEEICRLKFIEAAAHGLLIEGKRVGKEREGEWMAQQLFNVKEGAAEEVYPVCARLYSMDSFLYRSMNKLLRLITDYNGGSKTEVDDSISTFGPFIYLLASFYPPNGNSCKTVYRGALLSDDMIDQFQQACITKEIQSFPAFTSASRNRDVAEVYAGNVLFRIDVDWEGSDISPYSNFPDEEEVLIRNDFLFVVNSVLFDTTKKIWIIHLESSNEPSI
ncbi:unnamed protein product [Rotaria sp. Silwood2]|nr:unnamed protein product [Rotaria sp. Silwood2]CAF3252182.1 unnamed protein product [Rotaria sp. Silwood2]CAF4160930.1 unnamed protein product [Rotaria sp. Silwood2]CAF4206451.1 unnamed protein product [Rotaria sp. Silwood2]